MTDDGPVGAPAAPSAPPAGLSAGLSDHGLHGLFVAGGAGLSWTERTSGGPGLSWTQRIKGTLVLMVVSYVHVVKDLLCQMLMMCVCVSAGIPRPPRKPGE